MTKRKGGGRASRRKGQEGEREVFGLLSDLLGKVVRRNVNARQGDCDCLEIPGWACESKRCERWEEAYWHQTLEQARATHRKPVLFFRESRRPWVAMVDLMTIAKENVAAQRYRVQMTLEAFAAIVREELSAGIVCVNQDKQIFMYARGRPEVIKLGRGG